MAVTVAELKSYVGATESDYDALLADCVDEAVELVDKYVGEASVPDSILDRAYLEVAADLFNRRNAPSGIVNQQFATIDGVSATPLRIARDPMASAYKILQRWVLPF